MTADESTLHLATGGCPPTRPCTSALAAAAPADGCGPHGWEAACQGSTDGGSLRLLAPTQPWQQACAVADISIFPPWCRPRGRLPGLAAGHLCRRRQLGGSAGAAERGAAGAHAGAAAARAAPLHLCCTRCPFGFAGSGVGHCPAWHAVHSCHGPSTPSCQPTRALANPLAAPAGQLCVQGGQPVRGCGLQGALRWAGAGAPLGRLWAAPRRLRAGCGGACAPAVLLAATILQADRVLGLARSVAGPPSPAAVWHQLRDQQVAEHQLALGQVGTPAAGTLKGGLPPGPPHPSKAVVSAPAMT